MGLPIERRRTRESREQQSASLAAFGAGNTTLEIGLVRKLRPGRERGVAKGSGTLREEGERVG